MRFIDQKIDKESFKGWGQVPAAFTCPHCGKVYIVSGTRIHNGIRKCPSCGKSTGYCDIKGKKSGGIARVEW